MFGKHNHRNEHNQNTNRTRQTQFSNSTRVHFISSLSDFTQEEIQATWLTKEDNANIQIDTIKTVKKMRKGKHIDEQEKYSARGLEHMRTADHLEQQKMNKAAVCNAVLAEQRRQRQSGYFDLMRLSAQSRLHSEKSRADALRLGASDAAAAGNEQRNCSSIIFKTPCKKGSEMVALGSTPSIESDNCTSILKCALQVNCSSDIPKVFIKSESSLSFNKLMLRKCSSKKFPQKKAFSAGLQPAFVRVLRWNQAALR